MESRIVFMSLYDLKLNSGQLDGVPANPRTIKKAEFKKLVNSILVFPTMTLLRPITVYKNVVLGGNRRTEALELIAMMSIKQVSEKLDEVGDYNDKSVEAKAEIIEFWRKFINDDEKIVLVQEIVGEPTAEELKEFIIKDNGEFGDNDYDMLHEHWNHESLKNWGLSLPKTWEVSEDAPKDDKANNTKKSIQISFEPEDYVDAYRVIQWFRDNKIYIGKDVLKFLDELKKQHGENINN